MSRQGTVCSGEDSGSLLSNQQIDHSLEMWHHIKQPKELEWDFSWFLTEQQKICFQSISINSILECYLFDAENRYFRISLQLEEFWNHIPGCSAQSRPKIYQNSFPPNKVWYSTQRLLQPSMLWVCSLVFHHSYQTNSLKLYSILIHHININKHLILTSIYYSKLLL